MRLFAALLLVAAPLLATAEDEHVKVSLLSEQSSLVPGTTAWIGVRFEHEPHWHTYWINPGDSGLPTQVRWQLPPGFRAAEIAWPAPQRIPVGGLYNFGYEGDVLLPVPIEVPASAAADTSVHLAAEIKYLVCHEECVPGKAQLALDLPVRKQTGASSASPLFAVARGAQPKPVAWTGSARQHDDQIEISLHGSDVSGVTDAFVVERKLVNYAPPQISHSGDDLTLRFEKSDYFVSAPERVDLVVRSGAQARSVSVPFTSSAQ